MPGSGPGSGGGTGPGPGFITITIADGGSFNLRVRQLATWGARISDLSHPFEQIGEDILGDVAQQFQTEGAFIFRAWRWAPLAPSTRRERARLGFGAAHPILERSGRLRRSFERGAPDNIFRVTPTGVTVGSSYWLASIHQHGSQRPGRLVSRVTRLPYGYGFKVSAERLDRLPARRMIGISWQRRSAIVKRLNDYIQAEALAQGLATNGGGSTGAAGAATGGQP